MNDPQLIVGDHKGRVENHYTQNGQSHEQTAAFLNAGEQGLSLTRDQPWGGLAVKAALVVQTGNTNLHQLLNFQPLTGENTGEGRELLEVQRVDKNLHLRISTQKKCDFTGGMLRGYQKRK